MKWVDALKQYNYGTGMYCVPRKGTAEYEAVLHIMNSDQTETVTHKKKRTTAGKKDKTKRPAGKRTEKHTESEKQTDYTVDKEYTDLMAEIDMALGH
jgi:hypothetical protein